MLGYTEVSARVIVLLANYKANGPITIEQVVYLSMMGIDSAMHIIIWHRYRTTIIVNNTDG